MNYSVTDTFIFNISSILNENYLGEIGLMHSVTAYTLSVLVVFNFIYWRTIDAYIIFCSTPTL